jgi:hypothetical protein
MQRSLRIGGWIAVVATVVLVARTLAYALAPDPRAEALGRVTGGPRPVVVGAIAVGLAALVAAAALWLSALGVRERHRLRPAADAPRLRIVPVLVRALAIGVVSSIVFTVVEVGIHMHEGLGFHGVHCIVGPVHENALPLIAALALVAAAVVEAVRHAYAFGRRIAEARPLRRRVPGAPRTHALFSFPLDAHGFGLRAAPSGRGPPAPSLR